MKTFAEKIIDSMVDENGHCGERGLSHKQFDILKQNLHITDTKERGGWHGTYSGISFSEDIWEGTIGRYEVKLSCYHHFNDRCTVVNIDKWIDELPDFELSEYVGEVKSRIEREVTYIGESSYERKAYTYGWETVYIYKFIDEDGNLLIWKTTAVFGYWFKDDEGQDEWSCFKPGDILKLRGTVKAHDEYRGTKQTVLNRCKVIV